MNLNIYRAAVLQHTVNIGDTAKLSHALMGEHTITVPVESATVLDIRVGDYITFETVNYYINVLPKVKKVSSQKYSYTLVFESVYYDLGKVLMQTIDQTGYVNGLSEWYLFGNAQDVITQIVANMNRAYTGWTAGTFTATTDKNWYFQNESCLSVLQRLAKDYGLEFYLNNKQVNFGKAGVSRAYTFEYGKGKGLYSLERSQNGNENIVTRLFAFGSDKNLMYTYRNRSPRLKFYVNSKSYLEQNTSTYGVVEKTVVWDSVYPHRTGTISTVDGTNNLIFYRYRDEL